LSHRSAQIDHDAALAHDIAVSFGYHCSAPGGHQNAWPPGKFEQHLALSFSKSGLSFDFKNQAHAGAGAGFNLMVTVIKSQTKFFSQPVANRGLAGTHRPDQVNILRLAGHARVLIHACTRFEHWVPWRNFFETSLSIPDDSIFHIIHGIARRLFTLEILQPAEKYVILPFTSFIADISVWIIQFFDQGVIAKANVIRDQASGFGVRIERGCNGVEAMIILFAAIFAFPAPFKNKLIGFVVGFFAIQILNSGGSSACFTSANGTRLPSNGSTSTCGRRLLSWMRWSFG
jgi:exosortase H (IPTLxxWG-CTERM-specific)